MGPDQLEMRGVEFARDAGMPIVLEQIEFVREIDLFYVHFFSILTGAFTETRLLLLVWPNESILDAMLPGWA